ASPSPECSSRSLTTRLTAASRSGRASAAATWWSRSKSARRGPWSRYRGSRPSTFGTKLISLANRGARAISWLTSRPKWARPRGGGFSSAGGLAGAAEEARAAAGDKQVCLMGGADLIRQALAAGYLDELTVIVAPVVLGDGKRLFDGFTESLDFQHLWVRQS